MKVKLNISVEQSTFDEFNSAFKASKMTRPEFADQIVMLGLASEQIAEFVESDETIPTLDFYD